MHEKFLFFGVEKVFNHCMNDVLKIMINLDKRFT